jgi:hypothetical protein
VTKKEAIMYGLKKFPGKNLLLYLCIVLFLSGLAPLVFGEDELDIKKDKDKTVYTVGSKEDQKKDEDKENSWEMLKNMNPWIRVK